MKMKMPLPRGFDLEQRNTMCIRCAAPMFTDVCSRCGTRRPTKGPVDLIKKGGVASPVGGPPPPLFTGSVASTSNSDTTLTIPGITVPNNAILFFAIMRAFSGSPGANSATATFAGSAITTLDQTAATSGGNTYRSSQGLRNSVTGATGNLVVTFGGVIPDCKVLFCFVVAGSAFDYASTDGLNQTGTSFSSTSPPVLPTIVPDPVYAVQCCVGALSQARGIWTGMLQGVPGAESGGTLPVSIDWAGFITPSQGFTYSKSGYSTPLSTFFGYATQP